MSKEKIEFEINDSLKRVIERAAQESGKEFADYCTDALVDRAKGYEYAGFQEFLRAVRNQFSCIAKDYPFLEPEEMFDLAVFSIDGRHIKRFVEPCREYWTKDYREMFEGGDK